ncbi:MAG: hypothetical protein HYV33_04080 [Candidatus Kerfeldbacteria bacterium]|nr:hypothetical protein [Candidatus Kerfeldbacteria bacterium]
MNYLKLSIGLTLVFMGAACQPTTVTTSSNTTSTASTVLLYYHPTQCNANPWMQQYRDAAANDEAATITAYYQQQHTIALLAVTVERAPAGFISCQACGCPTGERITVEVNSIDQNRLLDLGFTTQANDPAPVNEVKPISNSNSTTTENVATELSTADQALQIRAQILQQALADYKTTYQYYPTQLTDVAGTVDTTGITYTPIGSTPANYYDLTVDFSTGRQVLNP